MQFWLANNDNFHFLVNNYFRNHLCLNKKKKTLMEVNKRQNVLLLWAAGVVPIQKCSFWLLLLTAQRCDILLAKARPSLWSLRLLNQLKTKFTHRSAESSDHPFQKKPLHDSHTPLLSPCNAKFTRWQTKHAPFPTSQSMLY